MVGALFWALTLAGCGYAAAGGERDGRWAALLIMAASLLTIPAMDFGPDWSGTQVAVLAVDGGLLLGLCLLALRSRRYFPIWMAGFQLIAVTTHLATMLAPAFTPLVYQGMAGLWAAPMTVSMVVGIALDRKRGITG